MSAFRPLAVLLALTSLAGAADVSNRDFHDAIRQNDLAQLKQLSAAASDVNLRDSRGSTPRLYLFHRFGRSAGETLAGGSGVDAWLRPGGGLGRKDSQSR